MKKYQQIQVQQLLKFRQQLFGFLATFQNSSQQLSSVLLAQRDKANHKGSIPSFRKDQPRSKNFMLGYARGNVLIFLLIPFICLRRLTKMSTILALRTSYMIAMVILSKRLMVSVQSILPMTVKTDQSVLLIQTVRVSFMNTMNSNVAWG